MASTYETYVDSNNNNNNNAYEEVDNSSEKSRDYTSSNSSHVDNAKKRTSLISFEDNKEKEDEKNKSTKRSKSKKEGKEGKEGGGLVRSLSGLFSKDKDKDKDKRNGTSESLRRTSSNSNNRRSFIFLSDDEDRLEIDTTLKKEKKSRQSSSAEGLEKDNSTKRNRLSVNLNNLNIGKLLGFDENKSSPKSNKWEDNFLEPEETVISPRIPKNTFYAGSPKKNKPNDVEYVESPGHYDGTNGVNKPFLRDDTSKSQNNSIDESPNDEVIDEVQSTNSSTRPSSIDDQYYKEVPSPSTVVDEKYNDQTEENASPTSPMTPMTPRLFITRPYSDSTEFTPETSEIIEEQVTNSNVESNHDEFKKRNFENLVISTDNLNSNADIKERKIKNDDTDSKIAVDESVSKKLQELESAKVQLEAKIAEQNGEINKLHSMEQIMQRQVELSERMTETMYRLESKQKEEFDSSNVGKIFEDTIQRLEEKIDDQKNELNQLKFIVGQLTGNQNFLITNGDFPRLSITQGRGEESQSQSYSGNTLVNTLVVNPLCNTITVSATIATSVLYAVYIRPIVGLVGLVSVARNARNARDEM